MIRLFGFRIRIGNLGYRSLNNFLIRKWIACNNSIAIIIQRRSFFFLLCQHIHYKRYIMLSIKLSRHSLLCTALAVGTLDVYISKYLRSAFALNAFNVNVNTSHVFYSGTILNANSQYALTML